MDKSLHLDSYAFESALRILKREEAAIQPSRREYIWYHLFNIASFLTVLLCFLVMAFLDPSDGVFHPLFFTYFSVAVVMICLLFLNIPFMMKLGRQANLLRRLGLSTDLKALLKSRTKRFWQIFVIILTVAILVILVPIIYLLFEVGELMHIAVAVPLLVAALSLISLLLMRAEKGRLKIVRDLLDLLSETADDSATQNRGKRVSQITYEKIAEIEREQIIRERHENLRMVDQENQMPGYTVLQSLGVRNAKAALDAVTRSRVEDQLFALIQNPHPQGVRQDPETGLSLLRVPETLLEIGYEVDEETRRLKIFYLTKPSESDRGDSNRANA